jgi:membrane protease YdiL (CAAX protease family)
VEVASPVPAPAPSVKPISLWGALLWFGVPGTLMYAGCYYLVPFLDARGVPLIVSWTIGMLGPTGALLPLSLLLYRRESHRWSWQQLKERFRLQPLRGRDWLWVLAGVILTLVPGLLAGPVVKAMAAMPLFAPPRVIPDILNPAKELVGIPSNFYGVALRGQWWMVLYWLGWLFFNILGEEFMWRGYLLPRMEKTWGRHAWVVNGLLWVFVYHAVMKWQYLQLLPMGAFVPFMAQRLRSSYAGMVVHISAGTGVLVMIILGILGLGQ